MNDVDFCFNRGPNYIPKFPNWRGKTSNRQQTSLAGIRLRYFHYWFLLLLQQRVYLHNTYIPNFPNFNMHAKLDTQTQNHINHWKQHIGKRTSQITWTSIWDSFGLNGFVTHFGKNSGPFVIILKNQIGWIGISEWNWNAGNGMIQKVQPPHWGLRRPWDSPILRVPFLLFIQGKLAAKRDIIHRNPCFS